VRQNERVENTFLMLFVCNTRFCLPKYALRCETGCMGEQTGCMGEQTGCMGEQQALPATSHLIKYPFSEKLNSTLK
jgi:hypothetical protein